MTRNFPARRVLTSAAVVAATALLAVALPGAWRTASAGEGGSGSATVAYNLGDDAFVEPGFGAPIELAAVVHYPKDLANGTHPLIVQLHGWWHTCADAKAQADLEAARGAGDEAAADRAEAELWRWPCAPGVPPLPSDRGYDYLGTQLAERGYVVVSISANGINAGEAGNGYATRAHLINKHLALWQQLATTGGGDLAGAFVDQAGAPTGVDFRGHVDLTNVGTMGHSRGGKGVMYQAADKHRAEWPPGVQVKAVLPLAPVYFNVDEDDNSDGLVTRIPIAVLVGTCDEVATQYARSYVDDARGRNATGSYVFTVHGANHNFFNTQWSPASGQVGALDDVRPEPGVPASECRIGTDATPDRRLTEDQQRKVAAAYVPAFFDRHLKGETGNDPVLTGAELPVADVARVDIDAVPPV